MELYNVRDLLIAKKYNLIETPDESKECMWLSQKLPHITADSLVIGALEKAFCHMVNIHYNLNINVTILKL